MAKKTKLLLLLCILIIILLLNKCSTTDGNYKTSKSKEHSSKSSMEMTYKSFKGYKYKTLKLDMDDELTLNIKVENKGGNLAISLIDEDDRMLYKNENIDNSLIQTIVIPHDGKYKIQVEGDHSGSFKISWNVD
ncbi:hypothetical protein [uncultured Clostridium sp.]|uniref:hypothetical protein n=1 Tax=uncultured Clostridium sp. TaxID=59620 RepID=UPI0032164814